MELPILCTLPEIELKERRKTILDPIKKAAIASEELPNGYAYSFAASSERLAQLSRLVDMERQCCQFLTFRIVVEAGAKPLRLEVVGTLEAKSLIADFFGGSSTVAESKTEVESQFNRGIVFESIIACPACGNVKSVAMPTDQCVFFYECESCHGRLRPKVGDCCVFCSYGSVPCPMIQRQAFKSE